MIRISVQSLIVILFACVAANAAPTSQPVSGNPSPFDTVIPELKFEDVSIEQAIGEIRERSKSNIVVDWLGANIDRKNDPVTLHLWNVKVRAAVAAVFRATKNSNISLLEEEGVLSVVSTEWNFDPDNVHVYDVEELLNVTVKRNIAAQVPVSASSFNDPNGPRKQAEQDLVDLITSFIAPDNSLGLPPTVRLRVWGGRLFAAAPRAIQERIAKFLDLARLPQTRPAK